MPNNILYKVYGASLRFAVNNRILVMIMVAATFFGTMAAFSKTDNGMEFFPSIAPEVLYVNVTLPDGSNVETSDRVVRSIERMLAEQDNIRHFVADVGAGNGNQMDFGAGGTAPHRSTITVELHPREEQTENPYDTIDRIRTYVADIPGAEIEIAVEEGGPPAGPPVNIELVGEDRAHLAEVADEIRRAIRDVPGLVNLQDDFEAGRNEVTVRVDRELVSDYELTTWDVADTVRTAISGTDASVLRENDEEYDIVVQLSEPYRESIEDVGRLELKTDWGYIPVALLADVEVERGFGSIRHVDGDQVITLSADVADGYSDIALLAQVQTIVAEEITVPPDVDLRYTGQNEDQAESMGFLLTALIAALLLIGLVLVTQFNSLLQPTIIIASVVLSLLGVLWILMIRHMPFSMIMHLVAIISLAGVVVNNSIVLIDYTNQLRDRGLDTTAAVIQAGMVRFRPVILTAVTTILSLMPTVLGYSLDVRGGQIVQGGSSVEMWGPMANAVVAGLAVATVLTLIVVPVLYSLIESFRTAGIYVARRIFEPASLRAEKEAARDDDAEAASEPEAKEPEPERSTPEDSIPPGSAPVPAE